MKDPKGKTGCILYCKWHLYFSLRIVPCNKLSMVVKVSYHQCFVDASDNKVVDKAQLRFLNIRLGHNSILSISIPGLRILINAMLYKEVGQREHAQNYLVSSTDVNLSTQSIVGQNIQLNLIFRNPKLTFLSCYELCC